MIPAPALRPTVLALAVALAGCSTPTADLGGPVEPLGEFRLGYNIVVADGTQKVEPSRDATEEEWERAFTEAIDARFSRFEGDQLYHIAVSVNGYSLAVTGIPVLVPPKSVAIIGVSIWDDAAGGKINEEPEVMVVYERLVGEEAVVGSGATLSREEQIENIAQNGARLIELWMRENPDWFAARDGASTTVRIVDNEIVREGATSR
jgi:urease gamma subunit